MRDLPSIFQATRIAYRALNRRLMASVDLSAADYEILCFIGESQGILRARISDHTGIDITSVGNIVRKFAKKGWIDGGCDLHYVPICLAQDGIEAHANLSLKGAVIEQEALRLTKSPMEALIRDLQAISNIDRKNSGNANA